MSFRALVQEVICRFRVSPSLAPTEPRASGVRPVAAVASLQLPRLSLVFTKPLLLQCAQSWKRPRFRLGRIRCRVISMRPNCEMRRIFVRARSRRSAVAEGVLHLPPVRLTLHVDEVVDDHAAEVAQPKLPRDFLRRVQVHLERGLLRIVVGAEVPAVHVDGDRAPRFARSPATRRAAFRCASDKSSRSRLRWRNGGTAVRCARRT